MRILDADGVSEQLDGLVHLDTQRAAVGLDLTVGRIARLTGPGALDFGGSEFEPARREVLTPERASPGDDYGWWELEAGTYVARYNEKLDLVAGQLGAIHPLPRLQQAGAFHPAFVADEAQEPLETLLTVGEAGCRLKENCRVSRLVVLETSREADGGG